VKVLIKTSIPDFGAPEICNPQLAVGQTANHKQAQVPDFKIKYFDHTRRLSRSETEHSFLFQHQ